MITNRDYLREIYSLKKEEKKKTNEEKLKNLFTLNSLYGYFKIKNNEVDKNG